jgi:hypothetical protein
MGKTALFSSNELFPVAHYGADMVRVFALTPIKAMDL